MQLVRFLFNRYFCFLLLSLGIINTCSAIDVNQATLAELMQLKGIGPKTAQQIITERERGGPYRSMDDLSQRIKGIGLKRLARLKEAGMQLSSVPTTTLTDKKAKK